MRVGLRNGAPLLPMKNALIVHAATHSLTSGATDITLAVIHKRAKRRCRAKRSELVNNCAAGQNKAGGRPALARSRSRVPNPGRVTKRLPAEPVVSASTSNRKASRRPLYQSDGRQGKATWNQVLGAWSVPNPGLKPWAVLSDHFMVNT
jgi:hypothetical protein